MAGASGCSVQASFPCHDSKRVWTALVAAARTPAYDGPDPLERWTLESSTVLVDDAVGRIEIHRRLHRLRHQPTRAPRLERRAEHWIVEFVYVDPPTATFRAGGPGVPSHVQAEARRLFEDARMLLAPTVSPSER